MESIHIEGTNEDLEFMAKIIFLAITEIHPGENNTALRSYLMLIHKHLKEQMNRPLPY